MQGASFALFFADINSISTCPSCCRRCPRCSRCTGEHGGVGRHATCPDSSVHLLHLEQLVTGGGPLLDSSSNQAHRIILAATSTAPRVEILQSHEIDSTVTWRRSFALSSCEHFLIVNNVVNHPIKLVISRHIWEHTPFRSHAFLVVHQDNLPRKQFATNFTLCAFGNSHYFKSMHFLVVNNVESHSVKLLISRLIWEHTPFWSHSEALACPKTHTSTYDLWYYSGPRPQISWQPSPLRGTGQTC